MKNKKGFTLVELLAVIAIIAIIGLIATPIVVQYVNEAKKDSIEESLNGIERAALTYFTSENIRNSAVVDLTTDTIEIKNKDISKGLAVGNREGVKIYIYKNGYCGIKIGDNIVVKEVNENECSFNIDDNIEIVTTNKVSKEQKITGYRIYGNTIDNNSLGSNNNQIVLKLTGKNLFDYKKISGSKIQLIDNGIKILNSYATVISMDMSKVLEENKTYTMQRIYSGNMNASNGLITMYTPVFRLCEPGTGMKYKSFTAPADLSTYNKLYLYGNSDEEITITNIQIEEGNEATAYEPYIEPKEYTISLKEPLRKIGNKEDYIDSSINQIVRNVGVKEDGSLYELEKPTYEYIKLPTISNLDGTTIVSVNDGNMSASKIEILVVH
ncbi:MAG: prepilin-type N-terminal cleavage/methylation domain-containing protein [Bacilli bacterium]